MEDELKKDLKEVKEEIDLVTEDADVPRNVKEKMRKAKKKIDSEEKELDVQLTQAIYLLNEAGEDINIPFHTRTDIMNITSQLEGIKEEVK